MSKQYQLTRRKALASLGAIGTAAAGAGLGTTAFFSDQETFGNNRLVAGSLDMKVAYSAHYSDWSPDEDGSDTETEDDDVSVRMWDGPAETTGGAGDLQSGETGLPANDAWLVAVDDPEQFLENTQTGADGTLSCTGPGSDAQDLAQPVIDLQDVKPGDFGEVTFSFQLCDNPGFVWMTSDLRAAAENDLTEPESKDEDEDGDADSTDPNDVELLDAVQAAVWVDDGNNYQNGNESPMLVGSLRRVLTRLGLGKGFLLEGDIPAEDGGGMGRNCFSRRAQQSVVFAWWLPVDHANEIQTDSARFDLGFYTEQCRHNEPVGELRNLGHSLLSDPVGGYTEEDIREDGQYAVLGSFFGEGGSFLVDLSDPANPTETHRLPSSSSVRNADVAFDRRDGLYYRTQEPNTGGATFDGVEVVDYGWGSGSPGSPTVIEGIPAGPTHNVEPHPEADVLYTTEEDGVGVWDTSDPTNVTGGSIVGPDADCHDLVADTQRDLLHCAFIGGGFDGYVIMDISDPLNPTVAGQFDYAGLPDYADVDIGEPGFESCHYAAPDPERDIAYVGDEIATGKPGGKHVFDIGWDTGSVSNPEHIGYTASPNAQLMDEPTEVFDWTTHNHTAISKGSNTLLVSGDYHEGTVLYDVNDPTDPTPVDQYWTDDDADVVEANGTGALLPVIGAPPMAWGADYSAERDLVVTSDMVTGIYTFEIE